MSSGALYERYRAALRAEPLPAALIDLDALERNVDAVVAPVRGTGKTLRVASKSVRCVALLRRIAERGGAAVRGVMAFSPAEASYLAGEGFDDILVAYPTAEAHGARLVAEANARGARVAIVADAPEHLAVAEAAAADAGARVPIVVDVDVSYRPAGGALHLGVRRSPSATPPRSPPSPSASSPPLTSIWAASWPTRRTSRASPTRPPARLPTGARKRPDQASAPGPPRCAAAGRAVVAELQRRGVPVALFNGGGTGSVAWSLADEALTEVTAGSGFLDSHLFDGYRGLALEPAAFFALQATRRPGPGFVTCQGGGFIASGAPGPDRLPVPYLPEGLRLTGMEGAGEVQTPLVVPEGVHVDLGAPVLFRHAKAGELAEHFTSYLLVRGETVEARAPTYRGAGFCFG